VHCRYLSIHIQSLISEQLSTYHPYITEVISTVIFIFINIFTSNNHSTVTNIIFRKFLPFPNFVGDIIAATYCLQVFMLFAYVQKVDGIPRTIALFAKQ
jgi:hypothetical protein